MQTQQLNDVVPEYAPQPVRPTRLLLVDDDRELCRMLTEYLGHEGFQVTSIHRGDGVVAALSAHCYAMVILDVMLPGASGLEVMKQLRPGQDLPIMMLTARGDDIDRVLGLELGADDYLPKPFNVRELVARVRAILRRVDRTQGSSSALGAGMLVLDRRAHTVTSAGETLAVTRAELRILELLLTQPGAVVSRDRLSREALGRRLQPWDRSVDTHVSNLRRKLAAAQAGVRILSVRGSGYQLLA